MRNRITYAGKEFSDDLGAAYRLTTGDCLLETSALSDSLAANTLEFEVDSEDTSLTQYVRNDKMVYEHKGKLIGTFYVQEVARIGRYTYRFSAISAMGLLMGKTHYGGLYTGHTVAEVVSDIVSSTGVTVEIKTIFQGHKLYGWLPIATARDNLAQVLFAIGAYLRTLANGVLRITSLYSGVGWVRGEDKCFVDGSVNYGTPVSRVIVTEHRWELGTESKELFTGALNQGDIVRFDEPVHDLKANGFTILESNCNYAKVSAGTGTLTGIPYLHHMRDITQPVAANGEGDDVTVKEAYLVSLVNSVGVAERLAEYYAHQETIQQDAVWSGEQPGDVVRTAHPYGGTAEVFLASVDLAMSGILRAAESGVVGYKPPQYEETVLFDQVEILTGSGQWTVPDGVTNVRAVLIGGGRGGKPGKSGENGSSGKRFSGSSLYYDSGNMSPGSGGDGGEGGEGGLGGDIYEVNLDVTPGQVFSFQSGTGGGSDAEGTATTFGEHTSTSGAPIESGYTEQISGVVYAKNGIPGRAGGRGSGGTGEASWEIIEGDHIDDFIPGAKGNDRSASKRGYFDNSSVYAVSVDGNSYGGLGGGAAVGANGGPGGSGSARANVDTGLNFEEEKTFNGSLSITPGPGGNGATPPPPAAKGNIGDGGDGGHGGGGGGGSGGGSYIVRLNKNSWPSAGCNISTSLSNGTPGKGGAGGAGGTGGPGGIILYYGVPKKIPSGQMKDKNGKMLLDRLGRRLIV